MAGFAAAFANGHSRSVLLLGQAGVGKSTEFRKAVGANACWIPGNASAFGIYRAAYEHRDHPIVLDDIDDLHRNPSGIRLLKSLCQTEQLRTVAWNTQATGLKCHGVPREFQTTSPVALIANDWSTVGPNVAAFEDRVHIRIFEPVPMEIHRRAAGWFLDQEIFNYVAQHIPIMERHSLRLYVRAAELKTADMDWKSAVLSACFSGTALTVAMLRAEPSFATEEDRVRTFVQRGAGCRATYFNHARRISSPSEVPCIQLTADVPPAVEPDPLNLMENCVAGTDSSDRVRQLG